MFKYLKSKSILIGLGLCLAACSTGTTQPVQTARQNGVFAGPTALPTRVVVVNTTISADGVLSLAVPEIKLSFDQSNKVATIYAKPGQTVKTGDVLATIDATTLQNAVTDAQLALDLTQANIRLQNAPVTTQTIAAAKASVSAAYASYGTTKAGNSQSDIETAKKNIDAAWSRYLAAQIDRDVHCGTAAGTNTTDCKTQESAYGNAFEGWVSARDSYQKLLEPVSQDALTQAYSPVASAKAKLDSLTAGETAEQSKLDAAQVSQAQATLDIARANLSQAKLTSPCDCIVQDAGLAVGVVPTGTAFTLVNLSGLQFKTSNLVESDVEKIKVGVPVTIRLKSFADVFTGKVSAVLTQSSGTQGTSALFTVLIALDKTDKALRPGMTGQAEIALG